MEATRAHNVRPYDLLFYVCMCRGEHCSPDNFCFKSSSFLSEELIPKYKLVSLLKKFNFIWKQQGRTLCAPTIYYFKFVCVGANTVRPIIFASNPVFLQSEELIPKYKLVSLLKKVQFHMEATRAHNVRPYDLLFYVCMCRDETIGCPLNS